MNILQEWMDLKRIEEETKAKRIEIEEEIYSRYSDAFEDGRQSATIHDNGFQIEIKLNFTYKPLEGVEVPDSCFKRVIDQTRLKKEMSPTQLQISVNKPTFKIVKE